MKYLYRILRLFFCPHKYVVRNELAVFTISTGKHKGTVYDLQCKYCGEIVRKEFYV